MLPAALRDNAAAAATSTSMIDICSGARLAAIMAAGMSTGSGGDSQAGLSTLIAEAQKAARRRYPQGEPFPARSYLESSCPPAITINRTGTLTLHIHICIRINTIRIMSIRVDPIPGL